jgi:hypothetical protein
MMGAQRFSTSVTVETFDWGFQGLEKILTYNFNNINTVINVSAMLKNKYRNKIVFLSYNLHDLVYPGVQEQLIF